MEINTINILESAGIAWNDTLPKLMNHEAIYIKYLKQFIYNIYYDRLLEDLASNDCSSAFRNAHTLRGTAGNLGIMPMYECLVPMTEELRTGDIEAARLRLPVLTETHDKVISAINMVK
jgi:chemotaxis protein histidine kinase CheA